VAIENITASSTPDPPDASARRRRSMPVGPGGGSGGRASGLSHLHVFILGWALYVAAPLLLGYFGVFERLEPVESVAGYFEGPAAMWAGLLLYAALMPLAFYGGSRFARSWRRMPPLIVPLRLQSWLLLVVYAILLVLFTAAARELLFQGYAEGVDSTVVGPIATLQMVLLFQYLVCKAAGLTRVGRGLGVLLILASVVLLGMGGRLYVASALVALYFYWWKWVAQDRAARRRSIKWALLAPLVLAVIGMWRVGALDISGLGFYLFAEPLFTSISAVSYFLGGSWHILDTPTDFFSAFINVVPTALWPEKLNFVASLSNAGLDFESPFGALSIITSSVANFGYLGGLAFIALVGTVFGWAQRNATSPLMRAFYCFLVSLLPFLFFRDPFQVQVKLVTTGFLLLAFHWSLTMPVARRARLPRLVRGR